MRKLGVGAAIAALSLMVSGTAVAAPATKSAP
jgi:hypothetical protein